MRDWIIRKLGGYASLEDVPLEDVFSAIRALPLSERHAILTLAVKRLFNTIGPDDILKIHNGAQWTWQGRPLNQGQIDSLKAETEAFHKGMLWKVLSSELRYTANKSIYTQSEDIPDLVAGKMLIYYIDVVESKLKKMLQ